MDNTNEKPKPFIARMGLVRLVIYFGILAATYFVPMIIAGTSVHLLHINKSLAVWVILAAAFIASFLSLWVYRRLTRWLEKRAAAESDFRPAHWGTGVVLAVAIFCLLYAILAAMGIAHFQGLNRDPAILGMAAMALISGICEELIFRGAIFRIVEDMFGSAVALAASSAIFGVVHLVNPHATLFSALAITLEAGILLGAAYMVTRNLWLAIGIHMGWNFSEGGIFSAMVSGGVGGHGILNVPLTGSDLLTGGSFGPEASVVTLGLCTVAGLIFLWRAMQSGSWKPFRARLMLD